MNTFNNTSLIVSNEKEEEANKINKNRNEKGLNE